MEAAIIDCLQSIEFGEMQQFKNMAAVPLLTPKDEGPNYLTLKETLGAGVLSVTEVDKGGSVPELKVTNAGNVCVLLLDGEELVGAKQNRVLNASILLNERSETFIPVSCTEAGRWSYVSPEFSDSGVVMSPKLRMRKSRSVAASLEHLESFRSDQQEVWDGVAEMSARAGAPSPTEAMRDVFTARQGDLGAYLKAFQVVEGQKGLLVMVNGDVAAFDVLSRASAYGELHAKLVKSYAMDALLAASEKPKGASVDKARAFVKEAARCEEKKHNSPGLGSDYRLRGPRIVGSALVYESAVIHAAFFRAEEGDDTGHISSYRQRRGFRI